MDKESCSSEECNCKEKKILVEGDGSFIAREWDCPVHGYGNSCWVCHLGMTTFNTELCKKHSEGL